MQYDKQHIQSQFIETLRKSIPSNVNLADEIAQVLNISSDSSYRRLRCETEFSLTETLVLCNYFDVPIESLKEYDSEAVTFRTNNLSNELNSFTHYLETLYKDLSWLAQFSQSEICYAAEDLPVFYSLLIPELARFKMCYWSKSILNIPEMQRLKIEDVKLPSDWNIKASKIAEVFLNLKSIEIWNTDTLKSTLEQIRFYWESGFFREKETVLEVLDELEKLLRSIELQAETGKKLNYITGQYSNADYVLYISELMIGNNCVLIKGENKEATYIGYNTFNFMRTSNSSFNNQVKHWQENLIGKSTLVSQVGEKQRAKFITTLVKQVDELRSFVKLS